jgi:flagellar basal-body rod protein FlgB
MQDLCSEGTQVIDDLGGVTSQVARLALDALSLRHEVIAHNIANARTPGFTPNRLEFGAQLKALVDQIDAGAGTADLHQEIDRLREELRAGTYIESHADQLVEIDMEMVDLTANVLQYRAIIEAQNKRADILRTAIRERSF